MQKMPNYNELRVADFQKRLQTEDVQKVEDIYSTLMGNEKETLKLVDRIVNYEKQKSTFQATFFAMSVQDMAIDFVTTFSNILNKLVKSDSLSDFGKFVASDNKHIFYIGGALVFVAVLVMLIEWGS